MIMHWKRNSLGLLLVSLFLFAGTAAAFATTDISVAMNEENNNRIQVMDVSEEKVCFVGDEEMPAPAVIHVSMEKDGEIYTGILAFSHVEKTAGRTYVGYYCGSLRQ